MDQGLLAEFLAECGLDASYQVEVFAPDDATTRVHEFNQPFLVVGQREGSDLRLDHWLVGRRHVYLQLIEGRFSCIDLGARTGTHGGIPTDRAGWVDPDRPLKIGPYLVRPIVPVLADRPYPPLPIVTWSKVDQAAAEPHWSMNRALALVGRSPFCEFRLLDPAVSRFHCGLVLTPRGVWAIDLLSQRPVLVNGQPIRFAPVRPGDMLQVGPIALTPHYDMSLIRDVRERSGRSPTFPRESQGEGFSDLSGGKSPAPAPSPSPLTTLTPTIVVPAHYWEQPAQAGALAVGPSSERAHPQDLVVAALVQQFGTMQQQMFDQMFDQFHQMMMGMFEQFAELHRETSASVRAEVDEVRKLSGEIESLRAETSRLAEVSTLAMQQEALDRSGRHQTEPAPPPPAPRAGAMPNRPGSVPASGPIPPPKPAAATPERPRCPPLAPMAGGEPVADIHAQLCSRLTQLETDRQGRWHKIWAMMTTAKT